MVNQIKFNFEDLEVWKKAVVYAKNVIELLNNQGKVFQINHRLVGQLMSASTSVALNIAEGSGRYSRKEFIHFLYVARGSLYETFTLLVIFKNYNWITEEEFVNIKEHSNTLSKMISGLIRSLKIKEAKSCAVKAPSTVHCEL